MLPLVKKNSEIILVHMSVIVGKIRDFFSNVLYPPAAVVNILELIYTIQYLHPEKQV